MTITVEVLEELVKDAASARSDAEVALQEAEARVATLRARIVTLRQEEDALHAVLQRRFPDARADSAVDATSDEVHLWRRKARTDAVEAAIIEITRTQASASPGDILAFLESKGRMNDSKDKIGGAVAFLNGKKRVHNLGRGEWVPGPKPTPEVDF